MFFVFFYVREIAAQKSSKKKIDCVNLCSSCYCIENVVFLSCPLVKKHADLSGSFLYSQSTMKEMYSKPTNRTKFSNPMKTKSIA